MHSSIDEKERNQSHIRHHVEKPEKTEPRSPSCRNNTQKKNSGLGLLSRTPTLKKNISVLFHKVFPGTIAPCLELKLKWGVDFCFSCILVKSTILIGFPRHNGWQVAQLRNPVGRKRLGQKKGNSGVFHDKPSLGRARGGSRVWSGGHTRR